MAWARDYPTGVQVSEVDFREFEENWGRVDRPPPMALLNPSPADDPGYRAAMARLRSDLSQSAGGGCPVLDEIEEFVTGVRPPPAGDRVLATMPYTDIVGSTAKAAQLGETRGRPLLERHLAVAQRVIARNRGRLIKSTGDGVLATFDRPARAVRCAAAIRDGLTQEGIEIRAGLHIGEIELLGDDIGGVAAHIGQRVEALANQGEVLAAGPTRPTPPAAVRRRGAWPSGQRTRRR